MQTLRKLARRYAVAVALAAYVIGLVCLYNLPVTEGLWGEAAGRMVLAAVAAAVLALATGWRGLRPSAVGLTETLRMCWFMILIMCFLGFYSIWAQLRFDMPMRPDWLLTTVKVIVLCLSVGAFEELLFRGVLFDYLLERWGKTTTGIITAVMVSSALFGFAHVVPALIENTAVGGLGVSQAVLKIVQAGMMGVLLCAVVLKTKNIWNAVLIHALIDFFPILSTYLFTTTGATSGEYVSSDVSTGIVVIIVYVICILLSLPFYYPAMETLKSVRVPRLGLFSDGGISRLIHDDRQ